jgi:hypothetical protein
MDQARSLITAEPEVWADTFSSYILLLLLPCYSSTTTATTIPSLPLSLLKATDVSLSERLQPSLRFFAAVAVYRYYASA